MESRNVFLKWTDFSQNLERLCTNLRVIGGLCCIGHIENPFSFQIDGLPILVLVSDLTSPSSFVFFLNSIENDFAEGIIFYFLDAGINKYALLSNFNFNISD